MMTYHALGFVIADLKCTNLGVKLYSIYKIKAIYIIDLGAIVI